MYNWFRQRKHENRSNYSFLNGIKRRPPPLIVNYCHEASPIYKIMNNAMEYNGRMDNGMQYQG